MATHTELHENYYTCSKRPLLIDIESLRPQFSWLLGPTAAWPCVSLVLGPTHTSWLFTQYFPGLIWLLFRFSYFSQESLAQCPSSLIQWIFTGSSMTVPGSILSSCFLMLWLFCSAFHSHLDRHWIFEVLKMSQPFRDKFQGRASLWNQVKLNRSTVLPICQR